MRNNISHDSKPAGQDELSSLHQVVAKSLKERILSGQATAADMQAAIKFLKDNGIDCMTGANEDVGSLAETMQFPYGGDDGDDDEGNVVPFSRT